VSEETTVDVDLVRLRYFATVAEHLHFGRAAAALNVARPTLSRALLDLEAELGVELFVRPSERTELTDAGRALLERATALLAADDRRTQGSAASNEAAGAARAFTIAIMAGVTVSKWTRLWEERKPGVPLRVVRTEAETQVSVLHDGSADVSFVRLPVDRAGVSTIPLYAEVPVVVLPKDHELTLLDSVSVVDLVEEHLLQDPDTVPEWRDAAATLRTTERRPLPEMQTTADAIALVAAGVGVVIVPQSVARLNHRKDVTYRPVVDVAGYDVALAWLGDDASGDVEEFIGIVRGRSARSSRSGATSPDREPAATPAGASRRTAARPRPQAAGKRGTSSSAGKNKPKATAKTRRPRGSR
jgi:DNA-binding transcriptional LysR family regulator